MRIIVRYKFPYTGLSYRAKRHGWPNTYVFTKAMGEMQLTHFGDGVPIIVLRPTIITSTYREPFPGWLEGLK